MLRRFLIIIEQRWRCDGDDSSDDYDDDNLDCWSKPDCGPVDGPDASSIDSLAQGSDVVEPVASRGEGAPGAAGGSPPSQRPATGCRHTTAYFPPRRQYTWKGQPHRGPGRKPKRARPGAGEGPPLGKAESRREKMARVTLAQEKLSEVRPTTAVYTTTKKQKKLTSTDHTSK